MIDPQHADSNHFIVFEVESVEVVKESRRIRGKEVKNLKGGKRREKHW